MDGQYRLVDILAGEMCIRDRTYGVSSVLTPINVQSDDRSVGELLADAGYQASWRCQVVVDSSRRRVEILYDNRHPARPASRGRG